MKLEREVDTFQLIIINHPLPQTVLTFDQMKNKINIVFGLLFLTIGIQTAFAQTPRVFVLNAEILQQNKKKILDAKSPDASFKPALAALEKKAQKALKTEFASIVTKEAKPPSGDKHDYVSQAPYFWRNPNTADGLPYIRRDGERNPEIKKFPDHDLLDKMEDGVEILSLAYYFTNDEEYAVKAAQILRMWFLDAETKMNPNLNFAQAIPGVNDGRGIGIIETRELVRVVDAVGLLENSKAWTKTDQRALQMWFAEYIKWLITSKNGRDEAAAKNNHGTLYDVQIVSFALFIGQTDGAKIVLENVKQKHIAVQIEADGSQPLELDRTKSWNYSTMNLEGLVTLAELGDQVGIDLWNFQNKKGGGIRKAVEFLAPYLDGKKKWKYEQIEKFEPERMYPIIRRAARKYTDEKFKEIAMSIPKTSNDEIDFLVQ